MGCNCSLSSPLAPEQRDALSPRGGVESVVCFAHKFTSGTAPISIRWSKGCALPSTSKKPLYKPRPAGGQPTHTSSRLLLPHPRSRGRALNQLPASLLTQLQEEEEQIFGGSRERLPPPVAKQEGGRGVLQVWEGSLEAFCRGQKAAARYQPQVKFATGLKITASARDHSKKWLQLQ